jgi:lipoate-protein ligase B
VDVLSCGVGTVPYAVARQWQKQWLAARLRPLQAAGWAEPVSGGGGGGGGGSASDGASGGVNDSLLLLEHSPVYTLGRGATEANVRFAFAADRPEPSAPNASSALAVRYRPADDPHGTPFEMYRVERGGEVTYHGPGQVVGYPLLDLRAYRRDLHWYVARIEEVLIRTISVRHSHARQRVGSPPPSPYRPLAACAD